MSNLGKILAEDYRDDHKAPSKRGNASPLHDLRNVFSGDIYTEPPEKVVRIYGGGNDEKNDKLCVSIMLQAKDKPNFKVKIFRAVPKTLPEAEQEINPGDWVCITRSCAVSHGIYRHDKGQYVILSKTVPASAVWTQGDNFYEWGYDP